MRPYISFLSAVILFAALDTTLFAQAPADDDGILFFPPAITVDAQSLLATSVGCHLIIEQAAGVIVGEHIRHDTLPLLPIIFFDAAGSTGIPERYQQFTGSFDAAYYTDTLPVIGQTKFAKYYQVLNIIGYRMNARKDAHITILGGYATEPEETPGIALQRAEEVRDYLVRIWRIDPARIELISPERLCSPEAPVPAREEARCVRIFSTDEEIFAPVPATVMTYDHSELELNMGIATYLEKGEVESIVVDLILEDSLLSSGHLESPSASSSYRVAGNWSIPDFRFHTRPVRLTVRAKIRLKNGNVRLSNPVTLPVTYNSSVTSPDNTLTLPFFHHRDTTLNLHQRIVLNRILQDHSEGKIRYRLSGCAEQSEVESGEEWIAAIKSAQNTDISDWDHTTGPKLREVDQEGSSLDLTESDFFAPFNSIMRAETVIYDRQPIRLHPIPPKSLKTARAAAAASYIRSHIPNRQFGLVTTEITEDLWHESFNPVYYPECRYYNRRVTVKVIRRPAKTYSLDR